MAPQFRSPVLDATSSLLYDSPWLAILLAASGAALLACSVGALAFYAFALADAKQLADGDNKDQSLGSGKRRDGAWNNTNSVRMPASRNLDPATAARAIEELRDRSRGVDLCNKDCELGDTSGNKDLMLDKEDKGKQQFNEQLLNRLRQQLTTRAQPNQWNLPAILELAEAASFANETDEAIVNRRSRNDCRRGLSKRPGLRRTIRKAESRYTNWIPIIRHAGVSKRYRQHQRGSRRHNKPMLHPSKLAEALIVVGPQIRRPCWTTVKPKPQATNLTPPNPPPQAANSQEESSVNNQQSTSAERQQRRLKLMLRLSQQPEASTGITSSSSGGNRRFDKDKPNSRKNKPDKDSSPSTTTTCGVLHQFSSSSDQDREYANNSSKKDQLESSLSTASGAASSSTECSG